MRKILAFWKKSRQTEHSEVPKSKMGDYPLIRFSKLSPKDKLRTIMVLGDSGQTLYFPLMEYALLNDPDKHIKFAVLKRLHLFKAQPGFETLLEKATQLNENKQLEPYFSMCLLRLEIISQEEFKTRINS